MKFINQEEAEKNFKNRPKYRLSELVKKIETSTENLKKRLRSCSKKIKVITQEHRNFAKKNRLYALAMTLTYSDEKNFNSKHITNFIDNLRRKIKKLGQKMPYIWVLERAEKLHYHLSIWLPKGLYIEKKQLEKWWPWGSTWSQACKKVTAWTAYLRKSESKSHLPPHARIFGYGGLIETSKEKIRQLILPFWLKPFLKGLENIKRIPGLGWGNLDSGEIYTSPWRWTPYGFQRIVSTSALNGE